MKPLLSLRDEARFAGKKCLIKIEQLDIVEGEKVVVLGPSGAGKSSFLSLLYEKFGAQVSWCPQDLGLVPTLSVFHNIYMGKLVQHSFLYNLLNLFWPLPKKLAEIRDLVKPLELDLQMRQAVETLSGGQRQRTALARAWYSNQKLFIGDEPTSSIDPLMAGELLAQTLKRFNTVIIASHDWHLALEHFDRVIMLKDGQIAWDRSRAEINIEMLHQFCDV